MTDNRIASTSLPMTSFEVTSAQIDESNHVTEPVTTAQLFEQLRADGDKLAQAGETIRSWIADGRITESTLTGDPALLEWIPEYVPGELLEDGTIGQLIGQMSRDQVNEVGKDGLTPLMRIMETACAEYLTQVLIDRGADINAADSNGRTVLMCCLKDCESPDVLGAITDKGVYVNARDKDGNTALHHGVLAQNCSLILPLIGTGIDKAAKNEKGQTAVDLAQAAVKEGQWNADNDVVLNDLKFSQLDALISLGRTLGEAFCAKLQNASTLAWYAIDSAFSYALKVIPYKEVVTEEEITESGGSRAQSKLESAPLDASQSEESQYAATLASASYVGDKTPSSVAPSAAPMIDDNDVSTPTAADKPSGI